MRALIHSVVLALGITMVGLGMAAAQTGRDLPPISVHG